jgi:hypothetical protein
MCVAVRDLREQFGATPKYVHRFFEGYSSLKGRGRSRASVVSVFLGFRLVVGGVELRGGGQDAAPAGEAGGRTVLMPSRSAHTPVGFPSYRGDIA